MPEGERTEGGTVLHPQSHLDDGMFPLKVLLGTIFLLSVQRLDFTIDVLSCLCLVPCFHFICKINPFPLYKTLEDLLPALAIHGLRRPGIFPPDCLAVLFIYFF